MTEFKFVESQIDRLSEITGNLGLFFFVTIFTPLINPPVDNTATNQLVWGSVLALASWWISLRLARISGK